MIINIPPENSQRTDHTFRAAGVEIVGNHQCMGNGFEDFLWAVSREFNLPTLYPGSTYNYYAKFFMLIRQHLSREPRRGHYFDTLFHCVINNMTLKALDLPVRFRRHSTKNLRFALKKNKQTKRIILISINSAVGRHIIRVNNFNERTGEVDCNDYFGKNPYTQDRIGGFKIYTYDELYRMGINSVCWIEDV
jgi:hypothetical protein